MGQTQYVRSNLHISFKTKFLLDYGWDYQLIAKHFLGHDSWENNNKTVLWHHHISSHNSETECGGLILFRGISHNHAAGSNDNINVV